MSNDFLFVLFVFVYLVAFFFIIHHLVHSKQTMQTGIDLQNNQLDKQRGQTTIIEYSFFEQVYFWSK